MPSARILSIQTKAFCDIRLEVPPGYQFAAGQYATLGSGGLPFSIASAPAHLPELRFLFRSDGSAGANALSKELEQTTITVGTAAGDVTRDPADSRSLTLICAGTGISQALSLLAADSYSPSVGTTRLYWARSTADMNLSLNDLQHQQASGTVTQCVSDDVTIGSDNDMQRQLVSDASLLRGTDIVVCGAPAFAYQCLDSLTSAGVPDTSIRADAFSYAPRPTR